ncbi:MAG TPA: tetratricopeptide repeat protein [Terriglobia bacterium]|nr:tetratricopeptide repeat protein [Terriglobia bacterium]
MKQTGQPASIIGNGTLLLIIGLVLVANSAYVAAFGDPTLFYVAQALLHPLIGVLAAVLLIAFLVKHRGAFSSSSGLGALSLALLGVATIFGLYLMIVGMTRPHSRALYAHVTAALAGLFSLALHLFLRHRKVRQQALEPDSGGRPGPRTFSPGAARETAIDPGRPWRWSVRVGAASAALYVAVTLYHRYLPDPRYVVRNPSSPPLSMDSEGGGSASFMFPSSAQTPDDKPIRSEFFMSSESCRRCHADIYDQWSSSMHHMASFNNQWYRKSIEYMQDTIGIKPSLWCGGCHDHALIIAGKMQTTPIRQLETTRAGQNGLGCMSCHAIVHVEGTMGQGAITFEYPKLAELAESSNPVLRWLHDYAVNLNPKPHRNAFLKPFHRLPSQVPGFCSSCHKVHLDVPVNNYRWIRGFNDYDNWQASGVSGQGARSFYYPPKPQTCADCHMPLVASQDLGNVGGFVHSHRFAAANTAVPTSYGDAEQVADVEKFLKGALSVDIFALAEEPGAAEPATRRPGPAGEAPQLASTFAVGEESSAGLGASTIAVGPPVKLMAPLGRVAARLKRGETVRVEVVVRTRKLGHFFPGGTVDAFDCWLELQARDDRGRVIFWSGQAADDGKGPVDRGAHFYRSLLLDEHGNPINKRNAWAARATMYARLIPPGAADTVHFRLKVPEDCGDSITLTAKLNYRKFSWWNTQFAFAGVPEPAHPADHASAGAEPEVTKDYDDRHWAFTGDLATVSAKFKRIPDVPIVEIAENRVTLPVAARGAAQSAVPFAETLALDPKDRERWNDYGIGLLLQGDLKGAERAFETVTRLDPNYADGWVNVARARVQEGNTDDAKPLLERAITINANLASAHYFYGLALKADGDYPAAHGQFALAAARYPNDRVNRNQMGRMLFLQRKYADAVVQYQKTLGVDPEDLEAHYNLMLCYRGLGNDQLATREEKLYLRFKADEASRAITGPYKLAHPEDNNEAQPIHEHVSAPLETPPGRQAQALGVARAKPARLESVEQALRLDARQGGASPR